jgi:hypothetical protein
VESSQQRSLKAAPKQLEVFKRAAVLFNAQVFPRRKGQSDDFLDEKPVPGLKQNTCMLENSDDVAWRHVSSVRGAKTWLNVA